METKKTVRMSLISRMTEPDGNVHETKRAHRATLTQNEDQHILEYEEENDGERCRVLLTFRQNAAEMTRYGMTSGKVCFQTGKRISSSFITPYGEIPLMASTKRILLTESEIGGELILDYDMYMGGERTSSNLLTLKWRV